MREIRTRLHDAPVFELVKANCKKLQKVFYLEAVA